MRLALPLPTLLLVSGLAGPALAQATSSESDMSQQGGAVGAMGRVGGDRRAGQSGTKIPDYGGDVSAVRRLPIGTTPPGSRSFVPAPRFLLRYW